MEESSKEGIEPDDLQPSTSGCKRKSEEDGQLDFAELPIEMTLEVFKYLPITEVIRLGTETALLNSAARLHTKWSMIGLRNSTKKALGFLSTTLKDLPLQKDHMRNDISRSFYLTRYISTEVELFFASVWRFREDEAAWTLLAPYIGPVVAEFEKNISVQLDIERAKPELVRHRMAEMFKEWFALGDALDNGLSDRLNAAATIKTPFEIRLIDILMCAPSYSSQLALKRTRNQQYNVYAFFKTPNLKAYSQVPDVFNSQLTVERKKTILMSYLRETVQQENLRFMAQFTNLIADLEMAGLFGSDRDRLLMINRLSDEYQKVHQSPYSLVLRKLSYTAQRELDEEHYVRCAHENLSLTGLHCIVVAPHQDVRNMPLAIPFLRGRRQKLYDFFECQKMEGETDLSKLLSPFVDYPSYTELTSSNVKPKLQLIIHYRESYVSAPSEVVVNLGYDDDDQSYLTFHQFHGQPLVPIPPPD